ncbi:MAG: hypothetical protein JWL86_5403 [Rhizobium sp.]|nr:hypothetical protein [Rhizobium sp.]
MSHWIVALPVWGAHYVDVYLKAALPSLQAALAFAGINPADCEIIVYGDGELASRPMPTIGDKYRQLGDVHRDALAKAPNGARVMLLTADMVVSREVFAACDARFDAGKRAIVVGPSRTLLDAPLVAGRSSRDLLAWSLEHAHPFTQETFFGGKALPPSTMRFRKGKDVTMRGFHLHPLAVVKDRPLPFKGTLDQDLIGFFDQAEIHIVTQADEMSAAELSPADLRFTCATRPVGAAEIILWAKRQCLPVNWWLSTHRIVLAGNGHTDDRALWAQVMRAAPPLRIVSEQVA